MKRIKIMLTAIMLVAVVGGALAFKAKKGINIYCGVQNAVAGGAQCPLITNKDYLTGPSPITWCTRIVGQPCNDPATIVFTAQ